MKNRFDRVRIRLEWVEKAVDTPVAAAKSVMSERADCPDVQDNRKSWKHRTKHHHDSDSSNSPDVDSSELEDSVSLEDSWHAHCHGQSSRSKRSMVTKGAICARTKSGRPPGLKPLKPAKPLYMEFLSYRYYWLEEFSLEMTLRDTSKVKDCVKRMQLSMRNQCFTGDDPILVLNFLARFVAEADVLGMSDAQAYLVLPYILRGVAEDDFISI